MQKVIHVNYGDSRTSFTSDLQELNSYLDRGWIVVAAYPVSQAVSFNSIDSNRDYRWIKGDYGVTFVIQKD